MNKKLDERVCCLDEEEQVTKTESYSTIISGIQSMPPKYDNIVVDTKIQSKNNKRPKKKLNWKRFLSYIPSWIKNVAPAGTAADGKDVATTSKANPPVEIEDALACTPKQSGHEYVDPWSIPKRSTKKISQERVLTYYNFQDETSDTKAFREQSKQKNLVVCAKTSASTETSKINKIPLLVGCAEISAGSVAGGNTSIYSCSCSERIKKRAPKRLVNISFDPSNTSQQCEGKQSSTSSACQKSIIEQAWAYMQKIITDHKRGCQRCNRRRSYPNSMIAKSSNNSQSCKESLLELARAYLKKISSDHKTGCQRCKEKETFTNPLEIISYLRSMLEQAWAYLPTLTSAENCCKPAKVKSGCLGYKQPLASESDKSCCKSCQQLGLPVCCKHYSAKVSDKNCCQHCKLKGKLVCCKHSSSEINKKSEISKYPTSITSSHTTCGCSGRESSQINKPIYPDNVGREFQSCPRLCIKKPSQEFVPPVACRSAGSKPHEHRSYKACCKYSSHGAQPLLTGSHNASCSSFQSLLQPQTICTRKFKKQPAQSYEDPQEFLSRNRPCKQYSSQSQNVREILEYHSSTQCSGSCTKDDSDDQPKQGLSLSMEPNDHKFCTPKTCKHSNDPSSSDSVYGGSLEPQSCTGACLKESLLMLVKGRVNPGPVQTCVQACSGGCTKCNSKKNATEQMYEEKRMVDAEYEAFLNKKFGKIEKETHDKEAICGNACKCMTCIGKHEPPAKPERKADPHNYRFYY